MCGARRARFGKMKGIILTTNLVLVIMNLPRIPEEIILIGAAGTPTSSGRLTYIV